MRTCERCGSPLYKDLTHKDPKARGGWLCWYPPCSHQEHNPPARTYEVPGVYEYVCPGCGCTHLGMVKESNSQADWR